MNEKGAWSESQEITKESVNIKAKEKSRERERERKHRQLMSSNDSLAA